MGAEGDVSPDRGSQDASAKDDQRSGNFVRNAFRIPCFRNTLLYSLAGGAIAGIAYNLATSKPPWNPAFGTFSVVLFGYWFYCRANFRREEHLRRQMQYALQSGEHKVFRSRE